MINAYEAFEAVRIERTARTVENRDFCIIDNKGRAVGQMLIKWSENIVADKDSGYSVNSKWVGKIRFAFRPQATRDGKSFGAIAKTSYFETEAARDEYAEKASAQALRRFEKKFGGPA